MPFTLGEVIIVDDDAAVRNSLQFALKEEGLAVRAYQGAAELLAAADLPAKGCLVIDYFMPTMNGVDLILRLRARQVDLPAILITSNATDDMRRTAAHAGIHQILEKPLEDSSLVDSIREALGTGASGCLEHPEHPLGEPLNFVPQPGGLASNSR
jgi:two-component system response regulator FixJ